MVRSFCLTLLLLCTPALAEVYTYIDADGTRVFTDRPPQNRPVERIQLAPSNRMGATPLPPPARTPSEPPPVEQRYQILRILSPAPDATLHANDGNLIVTASSEPALWPGHAYRLVLDGQPLGEPQESPVFALQNIDRGSHQVAIEIVDSAARIIERTPSQPFHVRRITLADKRRINPCQKDDYGVRPECPLSDKPKERDIPLVPFM